MRVEVTQEDINLGWQNQPNLCPLARAIKRAAGNVYARVDSAVWSITSKTTGKIICSGRLEGPVLNFRIAFDQGSPVKPFEFEIDCSGLEIPETLTAQRLKGDGCDD